MDCRCPHCHQDLSFRLISHFRSRGKVVVGEQAWACPHCNGPVAFNAAPDGLDLPFRLTGELAVLAIIGIAWVLALLVSDYFPVAATTVVLVVIGVIALLGQQWYLYAVRFASFRAYRVAIVRELKPWREKP